MHQYFLGPLQRKPEKLPTKNVFLIFVNFLSGYFDLYEWFLPNRRDLPKNMPLYLICVKMTVKWDLISLTKNSDLFYLKKFKIVLHII